MNPTVMHGLALGLLVSFGMVVGIAIVFATESAELRDAIRALENSK